MRKIPQNVYLALDEHGDVVAHNTNLAELKDVASGLWRTILRYSNPRVVDEKRKPKVKR